MGSIGSGILAVAFDAHRLMHGDLERIIALR